ncbi:MAG: hypothetical protein WAN89_05275 [Lawsonella sp.]
MKKNPFTRIAAVSMVALLSVGLVGCGDNGDDEVVTVTSVTNTTVNAPDKAGPDLTDNEINSDNPDFSNLSMDGTNSPEAKRFLKAVQKDGLKTDNMESAIVGMGYMVCYAGRTPEESAEVEDAMAQTIATVQPKANKAKVKKVVRKAAKKHLC